MCIRDRRSIFSSPGTPYNPFGSPPGSPFGSPLSPRVSLSSVTTPEEEEDLFAGVLILGDSDLPFDIVADQ